MRAAGGLAPLLFLVSLALAARSRTELLALTASFVAAETLACAIAPHMTLSLSPRFIEAAAALTIAYLAFEIILLPQSSMRWLVVAVLGLFHGAYFAAFLNESGYHVGDLPDRRRRLRAASDRLIRFPSGSPAAPRVFATCSAGGRVAAAGGRRRLVLPASSRVANRPRAASH